MCLSLVDLNPYRMGISGLLVRQTRSQTLSNDRALVKSCLIRNLDIIVIVTFIKRVDYQNIRGTAAVAI
jgi:hypothetical protein